MSRTFEFGVEFDAKSQLEIEDKEKPTTLLKYDDEPFEIEAHEFIPAKPYYMESNYNVVHPESSLIAHELHKDHHNQHHHLHHIRHHILEMNVASAASVVEHEREMQRLKELLDVISTFLPPLDFKDAKGNYYRRDVSTRGAKPSEVKLLTEEVEKRLSLRCAREVGYCPIRREIYSDCFDEILRQVILDDSGRGIVLGRIRDELRMTIGCYRRLNQSMEAYSYRKGLQGEVIGTELNRLTTEDGEEQAEINKELIILRLKHADLLLGFKKKELQCKQQNEADVKRRLDELDFFTNISTQLHKQMEQVRAHAKDFL